MESDIKELSNEFKNQLLRLYGNRFHELVLFGSYARGDFQENSDVDFLIILKDKQIKGSTEVAFVRGITSNLSLRYNKLVSILPTSQQRFDESVLPFYENVRKEGIKI